VQHSRYDDYAGWYLEYTRHWVPTLAAFLPEVLSGTRVLDLACGWGQLSRDLTARGASVTAVDLAVPLLERAREIEMRTRQGIRYLHGDACALDWWDGDPFDGVVCDMAVMDIDDLDAAIHTVRSVLRPTGWFRFALLHPCYPGEARADGDALPSWPPDAGYAREGWWTTESTGVRGHVGAQHRKLSTYVNAVLRGGLEITAFDEPDPDLPRILIVSCRRP
jgi:SAM-dependent methyltransferase